MFYSLVEDVCEAPVKYLDLAARIAKANAAKDKNFSFGCVAIRNDNAIVIASNIRTREPHWAAHCEARALRKCDQGAVLYLSRVDRMGQWAMAKPCQQCSVLIRNRMVKKVIYTVSPKTYAVWNP